MRTLPSTETFENYYEFGKVYIKRNSKNYLKIHTPYKKYSKGALLEEFILDLKNNRNRQKYINDVFKSLSICFAIEDSLKMNKKIKINFIK